MDIVKLNGTSCDKCFIGYKAGDVEECVKCNGEFCSSCLKNHDGC